MSDNPYESPATSIAGVEDVEERNSTRYPKSPLFAWIAPPFLLLATSYTAYLAGGWEFAVPMLLITSAHSFGHYVCARKYGVLSSLPYFVPALNMVGTGGAFVKIKWPIESRQALMVTFLAGPLAGLTMSFAFLAIGLLHSAVVVVPPGAMIFSEPLIAQLLIAIIHPNIQAGEDIALSPMGLAGWYGVLLNFWHLLPIGKFDGGRIVYALWGYRVTIFFSVISIVAIGLLSFVYYYWIPLLLLSCVSMINLRNQYPHDVYEDSLASWLKWLAILFPILIALCFVPEPISFAGW